MFPPDIFAVIIPVESISMVLPVNALFAAEFFSGLKMLHVRGPVFPYDRPLTDAIAMTASPISIDTP